MKGQKIKKLTLTILIICIPAIMFGFKNVYMSEASKGKNQVKGFFWKATKGNSDIYLIATEHPSKPKTNYSNDTIKKIVGETDILALEIDPTNEKLSKEIELYQKNKFYLKEGELKDLLNKSEQAKLDKILDTIGIDYTYVANMNPSGFYSFISQIAVIKGNFTGQTLDEYLANIYRDNNKNIVSLENFESTAKFFEIDTNELKKTINEWTINQVDEDVEYINKCIEAFNKGDKSYFETSSNKGYQEDKELYNERITNRNTKIVNKIDLLAQNGKKCAVAVGTYHFFGKDNIQSKLEEKGYKITNLE
ncbi:GumN family protein [[Clostridium] sordellii]|uniref:TraB/GumN family protein n=1 Tax=Paraclostridium sordellii TaxID=1505 RepID=UPI0005407251|nr:TraB/GumN family protein [Paeniclostridium sordellii]CEK36654.1 GumN family protein,TraB family (plasmid) [[Clostridium] sordellii] [Paeniclostridium sordellii]CEP46128.1 GumN family protein [[Clostridium] sordellii] [Paeniclostridium sordellii]